MALIKCKKCGHLVSDKAKRCPKCGCPIQSGYEANEDTVIYSTPTYGTDEDTIIQANTELSNKKYNKMMLWVLLILLVLSGTVYCIYRMSFDTSKMEKLEKENAKLETEKQVLKKKQRVAKEREKNNEKKNEIAIKDYLGDGQFTFKGNWESKKYSSQPCKLEFEKSGSSLKNCAYTNLKYNTRIPLKGFIQNDTLLFVGNIDGKQLNIQLKMLPSGTALVGEGIDYAHNSDKTKLNLKKDNGEDIKMPTYNQIINLYQHICDRSTYGDYNYTFVNRKNMQGIVSHIEGMTLLHCNVKKKRIYTEEAGEEIEFCLPIICCGINSEVSKIDYDFISDATFKSKSEHACGIFWFRNEYQDHFKVYFKNGKDALNFSKQMEKNTEYDGNMIVTPIGLMIDNYNPISESDGYVFNFRSF